MCRWPPISSAKREFTATGLLATSGRWTGLSGTVARGRQVAAKRRKLKEDLAAFFDRMETEKPLEKALALGVETEDRVRRASRDADRARAARRVIKIEREAREGLDDLEARYRVSKPRIGISRAMQKEWMEYRERFEDLIANLRDVRDSIESVVTKEVTRTGVDVSARERMELALSDIGKSARDKTKAQRKKAEKTAEEIQIRTRTVASECVQEVELAIRGVMSDFAQRDFAGLDDRQLIKERSELESRIRNAAKRAARTLNSLHTQLVAVDPTGDSTVVDQLEAVEQRSVALEEQAAADMHYAQLGMAIGIIGHEFGAAIRSVRMGLRSLKAWADSNGELMSLYRDIRSNFDHLDGYLTLFAPLQRRLYRKATDIRGWEIHDFLLRLFGRRLATHNIELTKTAEFAKATVQGYPSSFYPVFVNLVDNAIYWLSGQNERLERRIELDVHGETLSVRDSGPGVHARDRDDIFDIGFTRKPGGHGMGLHIARETLREIGYDLSLEANESYRGAGFLIAPKPQLSG